MHPHTHLQVIEVVGRVMTPFDEDNLIPVFGFGDTTTTDKTVFPFFPDRPARGFLEVIARYKELTPRVVMSGPTNFAPAIEAAMQIVQETKAYHILLIIADGQVTNRAHTEAAIIRASEFPLSIVLVGVGDGPWEAMEEFDDSLPSRKFDNFQVRVRPRCCAAAMLCCCCCAALRCVTLPATGRTPLLLPHHRRGCPALSSCSALHLRLSPRCRCSS